MKIDPDSPIPLYFQLKQHLLGMLEHDGLETGSLLPSEKELAAEAGLSRFTVRQALDELQREGWLEKHQGKGTFVSRPTIPLSMAWRLVGFSEDMARKGFRVTSKVNDARLITPNREVAKSLDLPPGRKVVYLQRLRSVNGRPFLIDTVFARSDLCPGLEAGDLTDNSLFRTIESRYHKTVVRARRILTIATAESWVAKMLDVPRGSPLYRLTDLLFIANGEPILYAESLIIEDRCEFVFELVRSPAVKRDATLSFQESTYPTPRRRKGIRGRSPPARSRRS